MGCVYVYVIILTFVGPEYLRRQFGAAHDDDLAEAAGHDTIEAALHRRETMGVGVASDAEEEKGEARNLEHV